MEAQIEVCSKLHYTEEGSRKQRAGDSWQCAVNTNQNYLPSFFFMGVIQDG